MTLTPLLAKKYSNVNERRRSAARRLSSVSQLFANLRKWTPNGVIILKGAYHSLVARLPILSAMTPLSKAILRTALLRVFSHLQIGSGFHKRASEMRDKQKTSFSRLCGGLSRQ